VVDPVLEGVAATLGHRRLAIFLKVSLPLAWPTIIAGLLLTWLRAFGEFGATVMVAYHPYSLPVYTYVAFGSQGLPAMLPVLLPALAVAVLLMALIRLNTPGASIRRGSSAVSKVSQLVPSLDPGNRDNRRRHEVEPAGGFAFRFQKHLNGFALDVGWSTHARRLAILGSSGAGKSLILRLRVALARALVQPADLMLFDEPFSALDATLRGTLRRQLRELQGEIAVTTVVVTHDPTEAALLADEILVLDNGRALQAGTVGAVFRRPASEVVARLLGAEDVGEGIAVADEQISVGDGATLIVNAPALRRGERVGWSVRPDRVRLVDNGRYEATIENVVPILGGCEVSVRLGKALLRVLTDAGSVGQGDHCHVEIDPEAIQVWPGNRFE
jgi:hypothetical protein